MKILIICGLYGRSTNGMLEETFSRELKKHNHDVYVVGMTEVDQFHDVNIDGVHTFGVKVPWFHNFNEKYGGKRNTINRFFFQTIRVLRNLLIAPLFPNVNPWRSRKVWNFSKEIIEKEKIDVVIGTFQPYEAIYSAIKLKQHYKEKIKVVSYHLDLLMNPDNNEKSIVAWKKWFAHRAVRRELKYVDGMMLPESAKVLNIQSNKIEYVGFPVYIVEHPVIKTPDVFMKDNINIVYCGSLNVLNRNPLNALRILNEIGSVKGRKIAIHIWGSISDEELKREIQSIACVKYYGSIGSIMVPALLVRADFLLNISNKITYNMIPSKIFQQLAAHRPILNFVTHPEDFSVRYFEQCGYALRVNEYEDNYEGQRGKVFDYIDNYLNRNIEFDDSLYEINTPEYIVKTVERITK